MKQPDTYKSNLGNLVKSLVDGTAAAIIAPAAASLTSKIKSATPVRTGRTRDSISTRQHSKFGHTIFTDSPEAPYIEYGTEKTPFFGMFRKTFDKEVIKLSKDLETSFKNHVEKTGKI